MRDGFEDGYGEDVDRVVDKDKGFSSPEAADEDDGLALVSWSEFHLAFAELILSWQSDPSLSVNILMKTMFKTSDLCWLEWQSKTDSGKYVM